jgi:hypothetical protein
MKKGIKYRRIHLKYIREMFVRIQGLCKFEEARQTIPRHFLKMLNMVTEIWKDVPNYEGIYQVSNFGNVKSKRKLLSKFIMPDGYVRVNLSKEGKTKQFYIHTLVWNAFNEIKSERFTRTIDHIDSNKANNALSNLQLLTNRENVAKHYLTTKKTSKYTGVSFCKTKNKWLAQYKVKNKTYHVGAFDTEHDAHLAYEEAIRKLPLLQGAPACPYLSLFTFKVCEI